MEIIKSKRKSKCFLCRKQIDQKYKVLLNRNWDTSTKDYCHLSCYFEKLKRDLERTKQTIKQFSKIKYKKQMILERL